MVGKAKLPKTIDRIYFNARSLDYYNLINNKITKEEYLKLKKLRRIEKLQNEIKESEQND